MKQTALRFLAASVALGFPVAAWPQADGVVCAFTGIPDIIHTIMIEPSDQYVLDYLNQASEQIHDMFRLHPNYRIALDQIPMAKGMAFSQGGQRYVILDRNEFARLLFDGSAAWAARAILAHEIGHLLQGHTLASAPSLRLEIEADEFAGGVLYMLGARLFEAQSAVRLYSGEATSANHPPTADRLLAVRRGWRAARAREELPQRKREYASTMTAVAQALAGHETVRARCLLLGTIPRPGDEDIRSFAWFHFWKRLYPEQAVLRAVLSKGTDRSAWSVNNVAFLPGTTQVVATSFEPSSSRGDVVIYDPAENPPRRVRSIDQGTNVLVVSPTGQMIAYRSGRSGDQADPVFGVDLMTLADGSVRKLTCGRQASMESLAFSPDGKRLASGTADGTLVLWDVATGKCSNARRHRGRIPAIAFSQDSRFVVSGGSDRRIVVSKAANLNNVDELTPEIGEIEGLALSADGQSLAVAASKVVLIESWSAQSNSSKTQTLKSLPAKAVAFSPSGDVLAVGGDSGVEIFDRKTLRSIASYEGNVGPVLSIAFSPDGGTLATGDSGFSFASEGPSAIDGTVRLLRWSADAAVDRREFLADRDAAVAVSHDGQWFAATSSTDEGTVSLWRVADGSHRDFPLDGSITTIEFSGDDRILAAGSGKSPKEDNDHGAVALWSTATGETLAILEGHDHSIRGLDFSADSTRLVTASCDRILTWAIHFDTKQVDRERGGIPDPAGCFNSSIADDVSLTRDGAFVASVVSRNPGVSVWNVRTESQDETFLRRASNGARSVLFSEDGALLAEGNADLNVLVWSRTRDRSPLVLSGHDQPPSALAFLPGGALLASSGGRDEPVRLWETGIGLAVGVLPVPGGRVEQLRFERDGLIGATSGPAMMIRWRTATGHDVVEALRQAFESDATTSNRELLVSALWALYHAELGEGGQALTEAKRLLDEAKLGGPLTQEEEQWAEEIEYAAGTREAR